MDFVDEVPFRERAEIPVECRRVWWRRVPRMKGSDSGDRTEGGWGGCEGNFDTVGEGVRLGGWESDDDGVAADKFDVFPGQR